MNVAEKIAPLVAMQASPPAHVHDVRFDEGADGEMWVYVNAKPDPAGRERQRYVCLVARPDATIKAELAVLGAELSAWHEGAKTEAAEYVQRELDRLVGESIAATNEVASAIESATQHEQRSATLDGQITRGQSTVAGLRTEASPQVRVQLALLELEIDKLIVERDATRRAANEWRDKASERGREAAEIKQRVARAEAEREQAAAVRLAKRVPPPSLVDRIEELRSDVGQLVAHASDFPGDRRRAAPERILELVGEYEGWLSEQRFEPTGRPTHAPA